MGRGGHRRQRLLLRLPAADLRGPLHVRDDGRHARRQDRRLLPVRAEPRGRIVQRAHAPPGHGEPRLARRARPRRDRERQLLVRRAGDRDG